MKNRTPILCATAVMNFMVLSSPCVFAAEVRDSFESGNDASWSRYEPLASVGGAATFTFPEGGYRIQAGPSPDPESFGSTRIGSFRPDLVPGPFFIATFDLVGWDSSLDQSFGLLALASDLGRGTTDGYAFSYSTTGVLSISLVVNERATLLAATPVSLDPEALYRFEVGIGDGLGVGIYTETGSNPFKFLIVEERPIYNAGATGFYLQADSPSSGVDATFDNFHAITFVPEPSTLSLLAVAGLAGYWLARRRQINTR